MLSSGSVVRLGEGNGLVILTGAKTYFGRTTELVQEARPKLHIEAVVAKVVRWLFIIVGALLSVVVVLSLIRGHNPFRPRSRGPAPDTSLSGSSTQLQTVLQKPGLLEVGSIFARDPARTEVTAHIRRLTSLQADSRQLKYSRRSVDDLTAVLHGSDNPHHDCRSAPADRRALLRSSHP